jgi:3-polyprenyl-4-hydroxybenzoate decarboxylase
VGAAISSGTFRTEGMVVIPCSMKTINDLETHLVGKVMAEFGMDTPGFKPWNG